MIMVNCNAMTQMCAMVLPGMVARNRGVVINISSLATTGVVMLPVYSATKAYVSMLSECLRRTYCRKGSGKT